MSRRTGIYNVLIGDGDRCSSPIATLPFFSAPQRWSDGFILDVVFRQCAAFPHAACPRRSAAVGPEEFLHLRGQCLWRDGPLHKVECVVLLDVVVRQCTAMLKPLAGEEQQLLARWDSSTSLDLCLDVVDSVRCLDVQVQRLACDGLFDVDLHASVEAWLTLPPQKDRGVLLDAVSRQCTAILKLLALEGQPLLVWRNSFLVLDLGLDIVNGVGRLDVQSDGLDSEYFDEDLYDFAEAQHKVECGVRLDVVVRQRPSFLKLRAGEDQLLLVRRNSFLALDHVHDVVDSGQRANVHSDGLTSESFHKDQQHGKDLFELRGLGGGSCSQVCGPKCYDKHDCTGAGATWTMTNN